MKLQRAAKIMNPGREVPGMICGYRVSLEAEKPGATWPRPQALAERLDSALR